jgi:hypothetical protein
LQAVRAHAKPERAQRALWKFNDLNGLKWCPEADLNHRHADFQHYREVYQTISSNLN